MSSPAQTKTIMQDLIERANNFSRTHVAPMTLSEGKALPPGSIPKVKVIVSCCDPRCLPEDFFSLPRGFEWSVIRTAGGRTNDALRSIVCMEMLVGIEAIIVVHHTDCGLTHLTNSSIRAGLTAKNPLLAASIAEMEFGEILDIDAAVLEDVEFLKKSPLIGDDVPIYGCVYDLLSGQVAEIV